MNVGLVFDALLVAILLWLAAASLASRNLFRGVVLFISFGLVLAIAWGRLDAPDVALAEAGIGAGLAGALLLTALGRLRRPVAGPDEAPSAAAPRDAATPRDRPS